MSFSYYFSSNYTFILKMNSAKEIDIENRTYYFFDDHHFFNLLQFAYISKLWFIA